MRDVFENLSRKQNRNPYSDPEMAQYKAGRAKSMHRARIRRRSLAALAASLMTMHVLHVGTHLANFLAWLQTPSPSAPVPTSPSYSYQPASRVHMIVRLKALAQPEPIPKLSVSPSRLKAGLAVLKPTPPQPGVQINSSLLSQPLGAQQANVFQGVAGIDDFTGVRVVYLYDPNQRSR